MGSGPRAAESAHLNGRKEGRNKQFQLEICYMFLASHKISFCILGFFVCFFVFPCLKWESYLPLGYCINNLKWSMCKSYTTKLHKLFLHLFLRYDWIVRVCYHIFLVQTFVRYMFCYYFSQPMVCLFTFIAVPLNSKKI